MLEDDLDSRAVMMLTLQTVLDALRARRERFTFEDVEMRLRPSVMAFITMNPGYPGRAELPESLKALFRPVSMCIPDLALICEIMLMAEGFQQSKVRFVRMPVSRCFAGSCTHCGAHWWGDSAGSAFQPFLSMGICLEPS